MEALLQKGKRRLTSQSARRGQEDWRRLYGLAVRFRNLAPWKWMTDDMLFAVQDPAGDQIGYCCVIGALGQEFGLIVYLARPLIRRPVLYLRLFISRSFLNAS